MPLLGQFCRTGNTFPYPLPHGSPCSCWDLTGSAACANPCFMVHEISPPTPRRHPLLLPKLVFTASLGIPINLLHEAQGHIVTVELANGQVYRGKL